METSIYESKTRRNNRQEILKGSKKLFISRGISAVTMKDISASTGISLRSMYDYYKNKEEIAIDIQIQEMENLISKNSINNEAESGYEEVVLTLRSFYDIITSNLESIKYITAFDFYFYNGYPNTKYKEFLLSQTNNPLKEALNKGLDDSSVDLHGLDIDKVSETINSSLFAFAQKNIYRERSYIENNMDQKRGDLLTFIELITHSIKGKVN